MIRSIQYTIESEAKAVLPKYIIFMQDGLEVGYIDATYDFTNCPTELHSLGLGMIKGHKIYLPSREARIAERLSASKPKRRWW